MSRVFRFAPSPNGPLHLGHAFSALLNADLAAKARGRLLLRMEDIDATRCRPEFETAILRDLDWLGIGWEQPVRVQSRHFGDYRAGLERLSAMGLIYPSFQTRAAIREMTSTANWPRDPDGAPLYPGLDRDLSNAERGDRIASGQPFALRLRMDEAIRMAGPLRFIEERAEADAGFDVVPAEPERWGDVVIARKEIPTSYHLSVVLDDALQGVTDVVRGADLFHATSVHRLLQALLGLPTPNYRHHRLIRDQNDRKLSKSNGDSGLSEMRKAGLTPSDVRWRVGLPPGQPTPRT